MRSVFSRLVACSLPLMLIAGCARREAPSPPPAPAPRVEAPHGVIRGAALSNASYVAVAASIELFEIQAANLALQRARTKRVRDLAAMLLEAHKGTSMQLSLAGRRLNLLPSATLSPAHQAMMDQLQSAPDFDSVYRSQQLAVHRDAIRIHGNYAARGTSPTLRPVAARLLPVFQRDFRLLKGL